MRVKEGVQVVFRFNFLSRNLLGCGWGLGVGAQLVITYPVRDGILLSGVTVDSNVDGTSQSDNVTP